MPGTSLEPASQPFLFVYKKKGTFLDLKRRRHLIVYVVNNHLKVHVTNLPVPGSGLRRLN